ncbi:MAG: hypothetical protein J7518_17555 [Nocardioidaceae bacterium]|nr:hypothetical protein [Nocardioidaceae bacterium]
MTLLFALLNGGGSTLAEEGPGADPYWIGGGILVLLLALVVGLLIFGKGREHS